MTPMYDRTPPEVLEHAQARIDCWRCLLISPFAVSLLLQEIRTKPWRFTFAKTLHTTAAPEIDVPRKSVENRFSMFESSAEYGFAPELVQVLHAGSAKLLPRSSGRQQYHTDRCSHGIQQHADVTACWNLWSRHVECVGAFIHRLDSTLLRRLTTPRLSMPLARGRFARSGDSKGFLCHIWSHGSRLLALFRHRLLTLLRLASDRTG